MLEFFYNEINVPWLGYLVGLALTTLVSEKTYFMLGYPNSCSLIIYPIPSDFT